MQKALNNVQQWCRENNMILSPEKTVGMLFSKSNNTPIPQVNLQNQVIRVDDSFCYLGLILDSKMTWLRHIEYLLGNIKSRLNLINVMCLGKRGASYKCLSKIIKAVIVSKFDYGSFIYGDTSKKNLKKLDVAYHSALRRSLGCLNSTPVPAMMIELGVNTLTLRRDKLLVKYFAKKASLDDDLINIEIIRNYNRDISFKTRNIPAFYRCINLLSSECPNITPINEIAFEDSVLNKPCEIKDNVYFPMSDRGNEDNVTLKQDWFRQTDHLRDHIQIFTDGSKSDEGAGCAVVIPSMSISYSFKLPSSLSIFSIEMIALYKALDFIKSYGHAQRWMICSDSASALKYLMNEHDPSREMVYSIHQIVRSLECMGNNILLVWVPAHVGIAGNESADNMAKWGILNGQSVIVKPTQSEYITCIYNVLCDRERNEYIRNCVNPILELYDYRPLPDGLVHDVRFVAATIFRLRTGHAKTRSVLHKWGRADSPYCDICNEYDDVRHILMKCRKYDVQRNVFRSLILKYFSAFTMRAILGHAKSPKWAHRKAISLLTKYIKNCNLHNVQ